MKYQHHTNILRLQLLSMARQTQRAVDESIKGYELGNSDFCRQVRIAERQLGEQYYLVMGLSRQLIAMGATATGDCRFALAAVQIGSALHTAYAAANQIADDTLRLLEAGGVAESARLLEACQLVNGLMRLCTIALFNENTGHARVVLQNRQTGQWRALFSLSTSPAAEVAYHSAMARNLADIAKQSYAIANALLIWLEEPEGVAASAADGQISVELLATQSDEQRAACLPVQPGRKGNGAVHC